MKDQIIHTIKGKQNHYLNILFLIEVFLFVALIIPPYYRAFITDAWSYALSVKNFLLQHKITFISCIQSICLLHIVRGIFFSYIFGYSLEILNFSNFLTLCVNTLLIYLILYLKKSSSFESIIGALLYFLNPFILFYGYQYIPNISYHFWLLLIILFWLIFIQSLKTQYLILSILTCSLSIWSRIFGIFMILPLSFSLWGLPINKIKKWSFILFTIALPWLSFFLHINIRSKFQPISFDYTVAMKLYLDNILKGKIVFGLLVKSSIALLIVGFSLIPFLYFLLTRFFPKTKRELIKQTLYFIFTLIISFLISRYWFNLLYPKLIQYKGLTPKTFSYSYNFPFIPNLSLCYPLYEKPISYVLTFISIFIIISSLKYLVSGNKMQDKMVTFLWLAIIFQFLPLLPLDKFFDSYLLPLIPLSILLFIFSIKGESAFLHKLATSILLCIFSTFALLLISFQLRSHLTVWDVGETLASEGISYEMIGAYYPFNCYYNYNKYGFDFINDTEKDDLIKNTDQRYSYYLYRFQPTLLISTLSYSDLPIIDGYSQKVSFLPFIKDLHTTNIMVYYIQDKEVYNKNESLKHFPLFF